MKKKLTNQLVIEKSECVDGGHELRICDASRASATTHRPSILRRPARSLKVIALGMDCSPPSVDGHHHVTDLHYPTTSGSTGQGNDVLVPKGCCPEML